MSAAAGRELRMASKGSWFDVGGICLLFILLSVVGIVWDIAGGLLSSGIDGIMLAAVCLMMAGIFSLMLLMLLHQAGLLPRFSKKPAKPKEEVAPAGNAVAKSAAKPAAPASASAASPATPIPAKVAPAMPEPAGPPGQVKP